MTDDEVGQKTLESAADFINITVSLATGALVFSANLTTQPTALSSAARIALALCWIFLLASIFLGVFLAQGRLTTKLSERNYLIHDDKWLTIPTQVHQWTFLLGVVLLGETMGIVLSNKASDDDSKEKTASMAISIAKLSIPASFTISKVSAMELVTGLDAHDINLATWHEFHGRHFRY